ncbi:MAG: DUF47 family protein [Thermogladius sp.]|nr:DUF47 family protein [Thermogladius sp.]
MSEKAGSKRRVDLIKSRIVEHALKVHETVEALRQLFEASLKDPSKVGEYFEKIDVLEHEADKLKRGIISEVRLAYLHPIDREDVLKMVTLLDDIAGLSKASSKRIVAYSKGGLKLGEPYASDLKSIIEASYRAVDELVKIVKSVIEGSREALERLSEVEKLEKEVDDLRLKVLEELYQECITNLKPVCVILPGLIDDLEAITDACEDAGMLLKLMFSSRF